MINEWEYISFLGPIFPGMRGLILILMSNVCYLDVIWIFFLVAARYLMVTACYCSLLGGYCSLPVVTARYRSLLLVPTFSMNVQMANLKYAVDVIFVRLRDFYKTI